MPNKKINVDDVFDKALSEGIIPEVSSGKPDIGTIVTKASQTHGVPEELIHAVIDKESSGRPNAKSEVGASGLMQLMPATAKSLGVKDINDPQQNINGGVAYLRQLHDQFGSWDLALAAYNAGPGNVRKYDGVPPFKETKNYVNTIMNKVGDLPAPGAKADDIFDSELEKAGLPPLEVSPPMQEGASSPQVPQTAEMSAASILTPTPQDSTPNASTALAASKNFLDALGVGAVARQMAKSQTLRDINVSVNKILTGRDQSFEDIAKERQGITKKAETEHPIAAGAGTVAGILAPVGATSLAGKAVGAGAKVIKAGKIAEKTPVLAKIAKILTEGAVQGGTYEAVSNPQASQDSITQAAKTGAVTSAVTAPFLAAAKGVTKGFGNALINFTTKTGKPEVAQYVTKYIGPTLTKASMVEKNQKILSSTEDALQSHLQALDEAGNKGVNMRKIAQDPSLLKSLESLDNVQERAQVSKILSKLAKYEEKGQISLKEANQFKRDLYKQANFNRTSNKFNLAEFQKSVSLRVKDAIESASGSSKVQELNKKLQNGIELQDALGASDSPAKLRAYLEVLTAIAQPASIPVLAAGRFATSTPGATTIGTATSKAAEALPPHIQALLNTLVPKALTSKR